MLSFVSLCPQLSISLSQKNRRKEQQKINFTVRAIEELSINFQEKGIQDVILVSSYNSLVSERMTILFSPKEEKEEIKTNSSKTFLDFPQNLELNKKLIQNTEKASIPLKIIKVEQTNNNFFTPLSLFVNHNKKNPRVLKIFSSKLGIESHFKFGQIIYQTIQDRPEKIAFIVSEDLFYSSSLKFSNKYFSKKKLDQKIINFIKNKDLSFFLKERQNFFRKNAKAKEYLPTVILLGFLQEWGKENWKAKILSNDSRSRDNYAVISFINN
jgi:aromatic ring-opening dioxygenase LigB subunit